MNLYTIFRAQEKAHLFCIFHDYKDEHENMQYSRLRDGFIKKMTRFEYELALNKALLKAREELEDG